MKRLWNNLTTGEKVLLIWPMMWVGGVLLHLTVQGVVYVLLGLDFNPLGLDDRRATAALAMALPCGMTIFASLMAADLRDHS